MVGVLSSCVSFLTCSQKEFRNLFAAAAAAAAHMVSVLSSRVSFLTCSQKEFRNLFVAAAAAVAADARFEKKLNFTKSWKT